MILENRREYIRLNKEYPITMIINHKYEILLTTHDISLNGLSIKKENLDNINYNNDINAMIFINDDYLLKSEKERSNLICNLSIKKVYESNDKIGFQILKSEPKFSDFYNILLAKSVFN